MFKASKYMYIADSMHLDCPVVEDQFQTFPLWSIAVIIVAALVLFGIPIIIIISIILVSFILMCANRIKFQACKFELIRLESINTNMTVCVILMHA